MPDADLAAPVARGLSHRGWGWKSNLWLVRAGCTAGVQRVRGCECQVTQLCCCCCCCRCWWWCPGVQVVLYTSGDVVERVKELTGGKGVKVVFDGGGSPGVTGYTLHANSMMASLPQLE